MNIVMYQIASDSIEEMDEKEINITKKLELFKKKYPSFNYKIEKDEFTNTLMVKQVSLYEQAN